MKWIRYIGGGLLALVLLLLLWGVAIEPRLIDTEEEVVELPHLPPEWEGRRIAVIADFQIGMWWANTRTIERIVDRLIEERPAAVLIVGDFVYKPDERLDPIVAEATGLVRPLTAAGVPTFAVLGNHDYSMDLLEDPKNERVAERVEAALERTGVRVLHNEAVPLSLTSGSGATPLYLVGIGSEWANDAKPAAAIAGMPEDAARLVFMHNPRSFPPLPAGTAPIAVAAHTHGGQARLPFLPSWSWMKLIKESDLPIDGWAEEKFGQPGNRLYVNRGIGFSDAPIRINAIPEITVFTLRRAAPR